MLSISHVTFSKMATSTSSSQSSSRSRSAKNMNKYPFPTNTYLHLDISGTSEPRPPCGRGYYIAYGVFLTPDDARTLKDLEHSRSFRENRKEIYASKYCDGGVNCRLRPEDESDDESETRVRTTVVRTKVRTRVHT